MTDGWMIDIRYQYDSFLRNHCLARGSPIGLFQWAVLRKYHTIVP